MNQMDGGMGGDMGMGCGMRGMGGGMGDMGGMGGMDPMAANDLGASMSAQGPPSPMMTAQAPIGRFIPSPEEEAIYRHLFEKAQLDGNLGYVSGQKAKHMFSTTGLPRKLLHEIWAFSDWNGEGRLDYPSFCVACRMLAHAQQGYGFSPELLHIEPATLIQLPGFLDDRPSDDPNQQRHRTPSRSPKRTSWVLSQKDKDKYLALFVATDNDRDGFVEGDQAKLIMRRSKLTREQLAKVWELSDMDGDGRLRFEEFLIAMHCVTMVTKGHEVPSSVPPELMDSVRIVDDLQNAASRIQESMDDSEFVRKAVHELPPPKRGSVRVESPEGVAMDLPPHHTVTFQDIVSSLDNRTRFSSKNFRSVGKEFDMTGASALEKAWGNQTRILGEAGSSPGVLTGLEMEMLDQRQAMEKQFVRRKEFDSHSQELKSQVEDLVEIRSRQDVERQKLVTACENYQDQISLLREQIDDVVHDITMMQESNMSQTRGAKNPIPHSNSAFTREEQKGELLAQIKAEREILRSDQKQIDELRVEFTRYVKDKLQKQQKQTILLEKHRQAEQDRAMLLSAFEADRHKLLTIRAERLKLLEERSQLSAQKSELETRRDAKLQQREIAYREDQMGRNIRDPFNVPAAFPASPKGQWAKFGQCTGVKTGMPEWESFGA